MQPTANQASKAVTVYSQVMVSHPALSSRPPSDCMRNFPHTLKLVMRSRHSAGRLFAMPFHDCKRLVCNFLHLIFQWDSATRRRSIALYFRQGSGHFLGQCEAGVEVYSPIYGWTNVYCVSQRAIEATFICG